MQSNARVIRGLVGAVVLGLGAGAMVGCSSLPPAEYARALPREVAAERVLDVQAVQSETTLAFTNTTAEPLGPTTLWLNRRFSRPLERVEVGERVEFRLREFVDEFGGRFREGGFWATQIPDTVVLAELEQAPPADAPEGTPPRMIGLVVVRPPR